MNLMTPREIFIQACNDIAVPFIEMGFKPSRKGQSLKMISEDKALTFEISFHSSHHNTSGNVSIYSMISIQSRSLGKWMSEQHDGSGVEGLVYISHVGHISPINDYKVWNLAGLSYETTVRCITDILKEYALPIFHLFESVKNSIAYISENGCCFNEYTKDSLTALPYVLVYGGCDAAKKYFNVYVGHCKVRNRFLAAYSKLAKNEAPDCGIDNRLVSFAYRHNLIIE